MTKVEKEILRDKLIKAIEKDLYRGFRNTWSRAQIELLLDLTKLLNIPIFGVSTKYNAWGDLPNV